MKTIVKWILISMLVAPGFGCGDDSGSNGNDGTSNSTVVNNQSNNSSNIGDRGGPQALSGFQWSTGPIDANGFQLELAFEFGDDEVIASNTCEGTTNVTTTAPIRYTYSAQVASGSSDRVDQDGGFCEVSIATGGFDFELVDDNLQITSQGETLTAAPAGAVSGLYGEWKVETEIGTLFFSMGNGQLVARNECTNGLTAETSTPAECKNFVIIEESSMGGDETCSVSIEAGTIEYRFEGAELILNQNGQEVRLSN